MTKTVPRIVTCGMEKEQHKQNKQTCKMVWSSVHLARCYMDMFKQKKGKAKLTGVKANMQLLSKVLTCHLADCVICVNNGWNYGNDGLTSR